MSSSLNRLPQPKLQAKGTMSSVLGSWTYLKCVMRPLRFLRASIRDIGEMEESLMYRLSCSVALFLPAREGAPLAGEGPLLSVGAHVAPQLVLPRQHFAAYLARG